jgi:cell division protein FtsL
LFTILFSAFCQISAESFPYNQDSVKKVFIETAQKRTQYAKKRQARITEIKKMLGVPDMSRYQEYNINYKLYDEYKVFLSDSAIYYMKQNLQLAQGLKDRYLFLQSTIKLAHLYTVAGMYSDSFRLLSSISSSGLPRELLVDYYDTFKQYYNYYSNTNPFFTKEYYKQSSLYRDSLLSILPPGSNHYRIVYADKLYDGKQYEKAKSMLLTMIKNTKEDSHEKAVLAFSLGNVYKQENDAERQYICFMISAICDMKNAIKENASLRSLAILMYERGDIDDAFMCIQFSMEDATFCNARLRTVEVSQIFPIIDNAYRNKIESKNKELSFFLIIISLLSCALIFAIVYVYKQMNRISGIRKELYRANIKLIEMNEELQEANSRKQEVNNELSEANRLKEVYIGQFLDLCSSYIDKLKAFKGNLNKKAAERKLDDLYKMLKSDEIIDSELSELYKIFDKVFLHLYPGFVEEFNSLLLPEERFVLENPLELNTELRIFALIRLRITDSGKIANFLHYSANTIYNYRTRVRNKAAVPRDDFENRVMKIGILSE